MTGETLGSYPRRRRAMRVVLGPITILAIMLANLTTAARPALAASPNVVISQVYGGGGNAGATLTNDFIELYNRGTEVVSLTGWSVQYASSAGSTWQRTLLAGSIAPGGYYLVQEGAGAGGTTALPPPDATGSIAMSGTAGKVAVVNSTTALAGSCPTTVDFVGYGGANCFEGVGPTPALNNTTAALRAANGATDTDNNSADFTTGAPNPRNSGGTTPPSAPSITTDPQSQTIPSGATATLSVQASGTAPLTYQWYQGISGDTSIPVGTNASSYTTPALETTTSYWVQVSNSIDSDNSNTATITVLSVATCEQPATRISAIQGSGATTPIPGQSVAVQGVVTGLFPGLSGFYLQEEPGDVDANPSTSEGIFVFLGSSFSSKIAGIAVGDTVRVTGTATEFTSSGGSSQTQIGGNQQIVECTAAPAMIAPVDVTFPLQDVSDLEAYEGMLVRFPQELVISEYFNYDRFGEIVLGYTGDIAALEGRDRFYSPTSIVEPAAAAALQEQYDLRQITLDDGSSAQNPATLRHPNGDPFSLDNRFRGGDRVEQVTGVVDQTFGLYRVQPTAPAAYSSVNQRPTEPEDVGGRIEVAAFNTLNYFVSIDTTSSTSVGTCGSSGTLDCRGADTTEEFERQRAKLLQAILGVDAEILGLNELENTTNVEPLADIVAGLNAELGAGTYDYIETGTIGTDAIKVGMIYKPAVVTPVGDFETLDSQDDPRFVDTRSRPSLAQSFEENATGARFTVVVNHLKSKGSGCGAGDDDPVEGNCNLTRTNAAEALVDWLATDPTAIDDADYLIVGDLNSYDEEDPINEIKAGADDVLGTSDDFIDLVEQYQGEFAYSYVFDGQAGYLDYALATRSLEQQVTGATEWHINADEPDVLDYDMSFKPPAQEQLYEVNAFRTSDHDPVIVGLNLTQPNQQPGVDAGGPYAVDEGGSVVLTATGSDPENGALTYAWDLNGDGTYETAGQSVTFSAATLDGPTTRTVAVQVTDGGGLSAVDQATVNVQNVAPVVEQPVVVREPSKVRQPVLAGARFSDPAGSQDEPFSCTVDFGDGSGQQRGYVRNTTCVGPPHRYPRVGSFTVTVYVTDQDGDTGSASTVHRVIYDWDGFFAPIKNQPTVNKVKAGSAVPIKFSLNGDQGRSIFEAGYPAAQVVSCTTGQPSGNASAITTNGQLTYDRRSDQYSIVWKTDKGWAGSCRELVVILNDGMEYRASFDFTK